MRIIGLAGPAGAGKSSAAAVLVAQYGAVRLAFADPIREAVLGLYPQWGAWSFEPPSKDQPCPLYRVSPRAALRAVGEHARGLDPLIYVAHMSRRLAAVEAAGAHLAVVDDVRLAAEAALIRERGGYVVHVERSGVGYSRDHATEHGPGQEPWDLRLPNPGSVVTFELQVRALMSVIQSGAAA